MKFTFYILFFSCSIFAQQNYTSYKLGSAKDLDVKPKGGICMMGGATENDWAMRWFLERVNGGDVLVLRTSGSSGYNQYMYSELGVAINSVESIVCNNKLASSDPYVKDKISKAEAIWFAGGDQSTYIDYWRNTAVDSLINKLIAEKNIVIGGTSAGMAILGGFIYTGKNGSIVSKEALANPFDNKITIENKPFLKIPFMEKIITDTHYDARDRFGRHTVFIARSIKDFNAEVGGIACEEYTSVCIDEEGKAKVFGNPAQEDYAYFLKPNCEIQNNIPESMEEGKPFIWNKNKSALKVYKVKGTNNGDNYFSLLKDKHSGGEWFNWFVEDGLSLKQEKSTPSTCMILNTKENYEVKTFKIYPNPSNNHRFKIDLPITKNTIITCFNEQGREVKISQEGNEISVSENFIGTLFVNVLQEGQLQMSKVFCGR